MRLQDDGKPVTDLENQLNPADPTILPELVLHLTMQMGGSRSRKAVILAGEFPANLGVEFPLPPDAKIIGTMLLTQTHTNLMFNTGLDKEAVFEFYQQKLKEAGWQETNSPFGPGGFSVGDFGMRYCHSKQGPALGVDVYSGAENGSRVRLVLNTSTTNSPCNQPRQTPGFGILELPRLVPPPKTDHQFRGGGGNSNEVQSEVALETELGLATLLTHYNTQLEKAGWKRQDQGTSEPLGWSRWTFQDKNSGAGDGLLLILGRSDQPGHFTLRLTAETVTKF